jgi:hypothetical protein
VPPAGFGEAEVPLARLEQIGGQQRVERPAAKREPERADSDVVPLEVVALLGDARVGEQFAKRLAASELPRGEPRDQIASGQRQAQRPRHGCGLGGQRDADHQRRERPQPRDQGGGRRVVGRRDDLRAGRGDGLGFPIVTHVEERARSGGLADRRRCRLRSRLGSSPLHPAEQAAKPELAEQLGEGVGIGLVPPPGLPRDLERHVGLEPDQFAAGAGRVGVGDEIFPSLGPRDALHVGQQFVERAELLQQFAGDLGADAWHPRHVVDAVAHERQEIDHLVGPDAPLRLELSRADHRVVPQVQEPHMVADQLAGILVAGGDRALPSGGDRPRGEGRQHVIGLVAGQFQAGDAHHVEEPPDERDLGHEVGGHLRPVGLVGL